MQPLPHAGAASPLLLTASAATSAQTMRIRQINHEAARNDSVGERVAHWKAVFREKGGWVGVAVDGRLHVVTLALQLVFDESPACVGDRLVRNQ